MSLDTRQKSMLERAKKLDQKELVKHLEKIAGKDKKEDKK